MTMKIIPSFFEKPDTLGDFEYMIVNSQYEGNPLFIFNDNVSDYSSFFPGGGNAVIRPCKVTNKDINPKFRRSWGIPTGNCGGFSSLDEKVNDLTAKQIIDIAIKDIKTILKNHNFDTIYYSADKKFRDCPKPRLGVSIFRPDDSVLEYITEQIYTLEKN
jgi:hypothetical protein